MRDHQTQEVFKLTMHAPATKQRSKKHVFLVDDHPVFRQGIMHLTACQNDIAICGEAGNAVDGLDKILKAPCDLVIADIALPGRSGLELIRDIHTMRPETPVLVLSLYDEVLYAERALRNHARGYIMKQEDPRRILEAIRAVLAGNVWFSERVSARLFSLISGAKGPAEDKRYSSVDRLTDRELEILRLIGEGKRNTDIAKELNLSRKTVDVHRCHIREKLGLRSGPEMTCYATRCAEALHTDSR